MNDKIGWKIIPWSAKLGSTKTRELVDHLENEGFQIELSYFEDRDNGRIPILYVWGSESDFKENEE